MDETARRWFLGPGERGNRASLIDAGLHEAATWTEGNRVEAIVHGATYFERLVRELRELGRDDRVSIADWRGDHDEVLSRDGTRLVDMVLQLLRAGVEVRGLLWRSHLKLFGFDEEEETSLAEIVNEAGAEILLDERVRRAGSHHQKLVVVEHKARPERDV